MALAMAVRAWLTAPTLGKKGQRAAARAAADNYHVIVLGHETMVEGPGPAEHHPWEVIAAGLHPCRVATRLRWPND
jgi:hypothetical protein